MSAATIDQINESADKTLAAGVLKQTAADLRRFHNKTSKLERELYRDAYTWLIADDFSWPYSFVNVCKLLNLCPDLTRTDVLEDASLGALEYWKKICRAVLSTMKASVVQKFAGFPMPLKPAAALSTVNYLYP